jgi:hypothetical protein
MGAELDRDYLQQWVEYFNLSSPWHKAQYWNEG